MRALANVAYTGPKYRDLLIAQGAVEKLVLALNSHPASQTKRAALFLGKSLLADPVPPLHKIKPLLPHLVEALWSTDERVLEDALEGLAGILQTPENVKVSGLLTAPMVGMIVGFIKSKSKQQRSAALRCVEGISAAEDSFGLMLLQQGEIIDGLETIIKDGRNSGQVNEACLTLSNLVLVSDKVVGAMSKQGVFADLLVLLRENRIDIVREAVWVFHHALMVATEAQVLELVVKIGVLDGCAELLSVRDLILQLQVLKLMHEFVKRVPQFADRRIHGAVVKSLEGGGNGELNRIELICAHPNPAVSGLADKIRTLYEQLEDAEAQS